MGSPVYPVRGGAKTPTTPIRLAPQTLRFFSIAVMVIRPGLRGLTVMTATPFEPVRPDLFTPAPRTTTLIPRSFFLDVLTTTRSRSGLPSAGIVLGLAVRDRQTVAAGFGVGFGFGFGFGFGG